MTPDVSSPPPSPPPAEAIRVPRRALLFAVLAAVAMVAAIAFVPLAVPLSWGLLVHYECGQGDAVATVDLWTPWILINAPYGGFGNGTGGNTGTRAANGTANGIFELTEWTVGPSVRVVAAGPGPNAVCTGYVAAPAFIGSYLSYGILRTNATSDTEENTSISYDSHGSVVFHNGYAEPDLTVDTCATGGVTYGVTASSMAVEVPFASGSSNMMASATLHVALNWTYSFPGHFGVWSVDDLSRGMNAPGGGWAFSFAPCP